METPAASARKTSRTSVKGKPPKMAEQSLDRHRMIAEAAYYNAMQRGFTAGNELEDWFMAEKQISQSS